MLKQSRGKVTYVPSGTNNVEECICKRKKKFASVLESVYWQTIGWVHTPPFAKVDLNRDSKFLIPESVVKSDESGLYTEKSLKPKLQIENRVPYGILSKNVMIDIEKRRFAEQDFKSILQDMGIETTAILPLKLIYKERIVILRKESFKGIPQEPFLELDLFDDALNYDIYSPEEWMSLGDTENGRKPLPAIALVPVQGSDVLEHSNFEWQDVIVLDYDDIKKLYLVRKCIKDNLFPINPNPTDLWISRIYLKFRAEEPLHFAKRLRTAVITRHMVEESLRLCYYVDCMPLNYAPTWPNSDLDFIKSTVRRNRQLQPKLQWIKDHLENNIDEITLEYQKAFNYMSYINVTKQTPYLVKQFKNEDLVFRQTQIPALKAHLYFFFEEQSENFKCKTFYSSVEVVRALKLVELNILALRCMSLYSLPLKDIYTLEQFETLQRTELQNISQYIHNNWMKNISYAILSNLENCEKGSYDLNQTCQHTFQLTKLGRFLKMIMFKMQDVIRFLLMGSLEKYASTIRSACTNLMDVKDNFVWDDSLSSNKLSSNNPIFEVPLEIKGDRLQFVVELEKYGTTARDLFEEGLRVTKDLPRLEKFVMKKMVYNPDNKLDTVGEKEKQVVQWKMDIIHGMERAMIAATAYIRAYDVPLKPFKTDQINYLKQFASTKANCDKLKQVIEMHNSEKKKLEDTIPSFVDIGPFRLITKTVRIAAIKKHEQLADAVLSYFYNKLTQFMDSIKDQFLMLNGKIQQPTGNIEDLLDKKQWCRMVPQKIKTMSAEVNRLRSDFRLISMFYRTMEEDDFRTFWHVQELPQISMKMLQNQISTFDDEQSKHKEHLSEDQEQLKICLSQLREQVELFAKYSDIDMASTVSSEIRKARKNVTKYDEQSQLYKKRERLFGLQITQYPEIAEISDLLVPYENFWLSTAEFQKYKERDISELLTLEPYQLRDATKEFYSSLQESLNYFTKESYPEIHNSVITVLNEVKQFIVTQLS